MIQKTDRLETRTRRQSPLPALALLALVVALSTVPARAFCEEAGPFCADFPDVCMGLGVPVCHREITERGLAFRRPHILERTVQTNLHMDHSHIDTLWSHSDGCDFQTTGHNVNDIYSSSVHSNFFLGLCVPFHCTLPHSDTWGVVGLFDPADPRPVDAAAVLGYALHPLQDLYSHSNWVEIFRGVAQPPLIEHTPDILQLRPWEPLDVDQALLDASYDVDALVLVDEDRYGADWISSDINFPPYNVPRILAGPGGPRYLGVISGSTHGHLFQEEECPAELDQSHTNLNTARR